MLSTILPLLLALALPAEVQEPGTAYCFGVGCPCDNDEADSGCRNSRGMGGRLGATGSNSILADDLNFVGTRLPTTSVTLVAIGMAQGQSYYRDGLLCLGGTRWRLRKHLNSGHAGTVTYSGIAGQILEEGYPLSPGDTLHFQIWNRDVPAHLTPCHGGANLTNAYTVTFAP